MLRFLLSTLALLLTLTCWGGLPAVALAAETAPPPAAEANDPLMQPSAMELFTVLNEKLTQGAEAMRNGEFEKAEELYSQIIERVPENPIGWGNRGNARLSQNNIEGAIADYDRALEMAPDITDLHLNRGIALEGAGNWEGAIADYNFVIEQNPDDALAYNNRGNAKGGMGDWEAALADYKKAGDLLTKFAVARANYSVTLYQVGRTQDAIRNMRHLVRKYPNFADMRAALTAVLWVEGQQGEAESQWVSATGLDPRYKDIEWVKNVRRWPPKLVAALDKFLSLN